MNLMTSFKNRASDSLDLSVVIDVGMERLKRRCKKSVLHSAKLQVDRLQKAKQNLEKELTLLMAAEVGIFAFFKRSAMIKKLKRGIAEINMQIVNWINSLYRRYVVGV
jgi:hypothetical protein